MPITRKREREVSLRALIQLQVIDFNRKFSLVMRNKLATRTFLK